MLQPYIRLVLYSRVWFIVHLILVVIYNCEMCIYLFFWFS